MMEDRVQPPAKRIRPNMSWSKPWSKLQLKRRFNATSAARMRSSCQ